MQMGVDSVRVRNKLVKLQWENGQLRVLFAKANAKIEYTAERHKMTLEQYTNQAEDLRDMSV
ncbi:hypothetical protein HETIRDRAFT_408802 [Heterobasidion irregulare TC 32-1]|uniref:Uncharacterized protein n=1 Tax=Heterobasidion irregulare (strain TC 32-1) TaxID=747525 RepID=W4K9M2_HETIT|nr:uncharacterized protein HETIRDRAFT_408802 [Heterobasidion irregulare TC 32-1]ETW82478.1 hypothetical protein HETIRDRAFT_408802 [Heterobasidion irregulare TC 32-1]